MGCYVLFKLNISNIYDFEFNKIFPGNMASSTKALECDMLVIRTSGIGHFDSTQRQYYSLFPYRNPENVISLPNSRWSHTAAAHMHESGIFELVDTGNQQSNKEVDWKKSILYI